MKNKLFTFFAALLIPVALMAQQSSNTQSSGNTMEDATTVGGMSKTEFERINKEGAAKVASISATKGSLSSADKELMLEVAKGGMQQLAASQIAAKRASSAKIRQLAEAEVEEQTGLAAKLKEIATAKGVTLPTQPDPQTQAMLTRFEQLSGEELDRYYMAESGVKGHEKLDKVMSKVQAQAKDSNLKSLAAAAHPLVRTHLQVARTTLDSISATGNK